MAVVEVEQLRCAWCSSLFVLCTSCFRGQAYCATACRDEASRVLHRGANARHQKDKDGRDDHRDRQRAYRARQMAMVMAMSEAAEIDAQIEAAGRFVTDSGSTELDSAMKCTPADQVIARRSLYVSPFKVAVDDVSEFVPLLRCCLCGVLGTHLVLRRSRAPP